MSEPKILVLDIETAPIEAYVWELFDQNIGLNQIKKDWYFLMWAAKWRGDLPSKTILMDSRKSRKPENDLRLVKGLWKLLNKADIVITQNGKKFDIRKFNARAIIHGLPPVDPFVQTDTLTESRKVFGYTSHKLEYMTDKVNKKYKKLRHEKYPGFELWRAVLAGDQLAWEIMGVYCIHDVLSTDEYFTRIRGWIKTQNLATYFDDDILRCHCGSKNLRFKGYTRTDIGKFKRWTCKVCHKPLTGKTNLLKVSKKKSLLRGPK